MMHRSITNGTHWLRRWMSLGLVLGGLSLTQESTRGENLLANGSFELGLGAEPFYPGWRVAKSAFGTTEVPPLPGLDTAEFHSGRQSLKLSRPKGSHVLFLDFQSPLFAEARASHVSYWVKTNGRNVRLVTGLCPQDGKARDLVSAQSDPVTAEWKRVEYEIPAREGLIPLRVEILSSSADGFDIWIDDICWSLDKTDETRSGPVELVLLPRSRNGIRFADTPVVLRWSADATTDREVTLEATVTDLSRRERLPVKSFGKVRVSPTAAQGTLDLGRLKRGAYWTEVTARDAASGEILSTGRERFTVLTDLRQVPAPVNFDVGYHGGIEFGKDTGFSWRGYWSLDEFFAINFQTGFRIYRDIWDWANLEPLPGQYAFDDMDRRVEAAARNGCSTILCVPHSPLHMRAEEYGKLLADPVMDKGNWIYKTAKEINSERVRSNPMNGPKGPQTLFAPDPQALTNFLTAIAKRYRGKIAAIEFINEANLFITPRGLIEYYFKPAYAGLKKAAPELPILMNQTMDFAADGNGYTGQFLAQGGFDHVDGITHHPYGASLLKDNGLPSAKTLERLSEKYSRADKPMVLAMTEIHGIGDYSFLRGEPVQRALIDWAIGCRWSAGVLLAYTNFYEGSGPKKWSQRGPFAPGVAAAEMNALYAVLGGYRFTGRIELDDLVLLAAFEREPKKGVERYAVALTAANIPMVSAVLEADLRGLEVTTFDSFGEPVALRSPQAIPLGPETIYLRSNDAALLQRIKSGKIIWSQILSQSVEDPKGAFGTPTYTSIYSTGLPPLERKTIGVIRHWNILNGTPENPSGASPQKLGLIDASGALTWPAGQIRNSKYPLPYVVLAGRPGAPGQAYYAHAVLRSESGGPVSLYGSATGPASLWVNGEPGPGLTTSVGDYIGSSWQKIEVPLKAGLNTLLVKVTAQQGPCVFALSSDPAPGVSMDDGFIRQWTMIGPWKNPKNQKGEFEGNTAVYPPEQKIDFSGYGTGMEQMPLVWHREVFAGPAIPHPWIDAISYGVARIDLESDTNCTAALGSDDGYALWINGELIGRRSQSRATKIDEEKLPVSLKKGVNTILFKIEDRGGGGNFVLRFLDASGHPVPWKYAP